jgi:hypothetical protein
MANLWRDIRTGIDTFLRTPRLRSRYITLMYSAPLDDQPGMKTSGLLFPASQYESLTPSLVWNELICRSLKSDSLAGSPSIFWERVVLVQGRIAQVQRARDSRLLSETGPQWPKL